MRITGGIARGRQLASVKGRSIRPTSDRVREAIFDLIGQHWEGRRVLDLFAGTGSLGLEALSRGASEALFVDYSPYALRVLKKNIERCGFASCSKIMRRDLRKRLTGKHLFGKDFFDLLFIDPPYRKNLIPKVVGCLGGPPLLSPNALLVVECSKTEHPPPAIDPFALDDTRTYGDTRIAIYTYEVEE